MVAEAGAKSLERATLGHLQAVLEAGVGRWFGAASAYARLDAPARASWRGTRARTGVGFRLPRPVTALGWALRHLGVAYRAAGIPRRAGRLYEVAQGAARPEVEVARALVEDGWTSILLAPRVPDAAWGPSRRFEMTTGLRVEQVLPHASAATSVPLRRLRDVPFFFGLTGDGGSGLVGCFAQISATHADANPDDPHAVELRSLERGPREPTAIFVPPGLWDA
jgi:hypothetical protein